MRKILINSILAVSVAASLSSCGSKWLETDMFSGVDIDAALDNTTNIGYALNGTYYQLMTYYFAGDYSTMIGDVASDIVYWNTENGHFDTFASYIYQDTDTYLYYIWNYGYKVVDNSARIVNACEEMLANDNLNSNEAAYLMLYNAEARCLRAYGNLVMANVFCHQAMVNGTSFLDQPGLVIVDTPIEAYTDVARATIGETYNFILSDLSKAVDYFSAVGDRGDQNYFGLASAYGLLARANMYLENWTAAAEAAQNAIDVSGVDTLAYTDAAYAALYANNTSNWESFFSLGITNIQNWSANSCGTLFTTYGYSYTPYLLSLYNDEDCRLSIMYWKASGTNEDGEPVYTPYRSNFSGGKFYYGGGNSAVATNYIVNAPEMFLIEAEAYANTNQISEAQEALLVVAKRNPTITSVSDLPSSKDELLSFLKNERARELFQEGFRMWDLRRWGATANLYATGAPEIAWHITDAYCGDIIFPIPSDEINAGFGVKQNEGWASTRPF